VDKLIIKLRFSTKPILRLCHVFKNYLKSAKKLIINVAFFTLFLIGEEVAGVFVLNRVSLYEKHKFIHSYWITFFIGSAYYNDIGRHKRCVGRFLMLMGCL